MLNASIVDINSLTLIFCFLLESLVNVDSQYPNILTISSIIFFDIFAFVNGISKKLVSFAYLTFLDVCSVLITLTMFPF